MSKSRRVAVALLFAVSSCTFAAECPWMHSTAVEKLLGSNAFEQQPGHAETCVARSAIGTLAVVTGDAEVAPDLAPIMWAQCTKEPLPALGEFAELAYDCEDIAGPLAGVHAIVGDKLVQYIFQPGRDPTAAERALLVQVARDSQAAAAKDPQ